MPAENKKFMLKAIELSVKNVKSGGGPFGAVIVNKGKIIGTGVNKVTLLNDPTAHAEVNAIRNAARRINNFDLTGCDIYTSCEPCPMCLSAIYWANISNIYFANTRKEAKKIGFRDDHIYNEIPKPISKRKINTVRIKDTNAIDAFLIWDKKKDKISY